VLGIGLALAASLSWGLSDYLGGVKSRVVPLLTLIAVSQLAGLALIAVITGATSSFPNGRTAAYAAIAGAAGVVAVAAFYRGMAIGRISIVAPISATGAIIPVVAGLARGERPGSLALLGMALAFVGVVLASAERSPAETGASRQASRWRLRRPSASASSSFSWPRRARATTRLRPRSCCA